MALAALGAPSPRTPSPSQPIVNLLRTLGWLALVDFGHPALAARFRPSRGRADPQRIAQPHPWVASEGGLRCLAASSCAGKAKVSAAAPAIQSPSKGRILSR